MSPMGPERPIDGMSPETVVQWSSCRFVTDGKANIVGDIRPWIGGGSPVGSGRTGRGRRMAAVLKSVCSIGTAALTVVMATFGGASGR